MNKDTIFADSHCHSDDGNQALGKLNPQTIRKLSILYEMRNDDRGGGIKYRWFLLWGRL
jgi:hypothetical protein